MRTARARATSALSLVLASVCAAAPAAAAPQVTLSTLFQPNRLGESTTIHWGFTISEPAPLRSLELRLPAGMGFAASSLGLEECQPALLALAGPEGCPADSRVGFGTALAEVPAATPVRESAHVTALLGPSEGEGMTVLFFVDGRWPANREIILTSHLRHLAGPHGATLLTEVPLLSAWPDGPDIGLLSFRSTIGPDRITYYRRVGHRIVAFKPRGLTLPKRCPRGGFPVGATFTWWTLAGTATATTHVPCPKPRR
jgi:hypothetical protein